MFSSLAVPTPDPLWGLNADFRADQRKEKVDLVVGVYRDESGVTPTMEVVKAAEQALIEEAGSKAYRSLVGNADFNAGMARLLFGERSRHLTRQHTIQTIGATGALRLLADLVARVRPDAVVWSTNPAYVNHRPLMEAAGLRVQNYRWSEHRNALDLDAVLNDLAMAKAGDIALLHGCCHNPTGIDLPPEGWAAVANLCSKNGLVPLIDIAYQGFGGGLEEDAAGLRLLTEKLETVLVTASCSKNMGLYCERTGTATVVTADEGERRAIAGTLERITRSNYSMPADHGAAVAARILDEQEAWRSELEAIRLRVIGLRGGLSTALEDIGLPVAVADLRRHKGMFSQLPLSVEAMGHLRTEFAIYGTDGGRINVAGLRTNQIEYVAEGIASAFSFDDREKHR